MLEEHKRESPLKYFGLIIIIVLLLWAAQVLTACTNRDSIEEAMYHCNDCEISKVGK